MLSTTLFASLIKNTFYEKLRLLSIYFDMSKIWFFMVLIGLANILLINPNLSIETMVNSCIYTVKLCLELAGIYALWLGVLEIMQQSGIDTKLNFLFSPLIKKMFKNTTPKAQKLISINLVANFLGMGNAATPSGIDAIEEMDNKKSSVATKEMILFMVLNSTAVQFFPTTVVGMRAAFGSTQPSDIFMPTFLSSLLATILGIFLCYIFSKIIHKKEKV